jgi:hypothetical protein
MQYRPVLTVQGHGDGNMRATHSPLIYVSTKTTQSSCRHIHVIMTSTHGGKAPCRRGTGPRAAPRSPQSRSPAAVAARTAPACPESDSRPGSNLSLVSFLSSLARNQLSVRYRSRKHAQAGGENEAGCSGAFLPEAMKREEHGGSLAPPACRAAGDVSAKGPGGPDCVRILWIRQWRLSKLSARGGQISLPNH